MRKITAFQNWLLCLMSVYVVIFIVTLSGCIAGSGVFLAYVSVLFQSQAAPDRHQR